MSEVIQAVFIRQTETRSQPKPHTAYRVDVHAPVRTWHVWKRYTEFSKLHDQLETIFPKHPPPVQFPGKRYFPSTFSSPERVEERRRALESYIRGILSSRDDRWRQTDVWKQFLAIPAGRVDPSSQYTSESWLDEYHQMTNTAREIRSLINRRGTHTARNEISASHNCTVQAKKLLASLTSRLSNLEGALNALAKGETAPMSEGELRRRQDMLSMLWDEKETLLKLVKNGRQEQELYKSNAPIKTDNHMNEVIMADASPTYGFPQQRPLVTRLGTGFQRPSATIATGRAFGLAASQKKQQQNAKETEVTRGLDNNGLVKLQQQVMDDQNRQVEQFLAILSRQKQIGMAIGDELDTQNQIMDELDADLGRTQQKLKFANKKLAKIN
ncbi:hypothetical protein EC973_005536 [Apophysomyces ossiformis]|uniref:Phox-like protein n=1 Tax=Apophysomyces ossiformis TaxID=679940 RepID=A0A8H7BJ70_9FUNG|nr:hypothetical protein EC973_005536 [Apophysomyces ossiformis]